MGAARYCTGCVAWLGPVLWSFVGPGGLPLCCLLGAEWEGNLFALPRTKKLMEQVRTTRSSRVTPVRRIRQSEAVRLLVV